MSYTIIYQYSVFTESRSDVDNGETKYVVAIEAGSNNCYDHRNRRARSWQVMALGNHDEVMRQAVNWASSCEGGMLKPGNKDTTPELFIKKIRRLLAEADKAGRAGVNGGWWTPTARVDDAQEGTASLARSLGAEIKEDVWYGQKRVRASFSENLQGFWGFVRAMHRRQYGWQMADVHGLASS